jgi:ferritin-like metal-binding protein YciE
MAENIKEQLLRYLNDAYAAEIGGMASLKDLAAETTDSDVRQAVEHHITVTQSQADRLTARILALGGDKSEPKGILNQVLAKTSGMLNVFHSKEDKQTQDTIKAYAFEHFEIGSYTALKAYANAIGDHETAQLAETIIGEEQLAAERLQRLIPQIAVGSVNNASDVAAAV